MFSGWLGQPLERELDFSVAFAMALTPGVRKKRRLVAGRRVPRYMCGINAVGAPAAAFAAINTDEAYGVACVGDHQRTGDLLETGRE